MKIQIRILGKLCIGLMLSLGASADEPVDSVFAPNLPKAKENFSSQQKCVEPISIIRSNHGQFLKHHRDDTMYRGVRTKTYSLVACINCHVTKNTQGNYPSIKEGSEHFCRSCHTYTAVTIDCFQCHASQPAEPLVDTGSHR